MYDEKKYNVYYCSDSRGTRFVEIFYRAVKRALAPSEKARGIATLAKIIIELRSTIEKKA